jgi:phenylacetate-CoA ligase
MNLREHAFLLAHDAMGSELRRHYREFHALSAWPAERFAAEHDARVGRLLSHARAAIPFYSTVPASGRLADFPIMRKDDVAANFTGLMEASLRREVEGGRPRGYSWVEVKSGGTTGTPTTVIHDRDFRDWGRASRLYSQHLCGFPLGTRHWKLWGSMRDISSARDSLPRRAMNALLGVEPLNAFLMDDARLADYARRISESDIRSLMAYVDAAYELARFIERRGVKVRPLESIMACAGAVTDDIRATLSRVFGARIHNKYGSRECADMACECAQGGFHIFATGVHLEVVDDAGAPVPAGVTGRILVTLLHNFRFPIIRYEIGDLGALADRRCACGSPFPLLDRVEGRLSERLSTATGGYLSPVYIRHLIGVVHNPGTIERFQFVQESAGRYALALQMDAGVSEAESDALRRKIEVDLLAVLGAGAALAITRADRIAESESGKFRYIVRKEF